MTTHHISKKRDGVKKNLKKTKNSKKYQRRQDHSRNGSQVKEGTKTKIKQKAQKQMISYKYPRIWRSNSKWNTWRVYRHKKIKMRSLKKAILYNFWMKTSTKLVLTQFHHLRIKIRKLKVKIQMSNNDLLKRKKLIPWSLRMWLNNHIRKMLSRQTTLAFLNLKFRRIRTKLWKRSPNKSKVI